MAAVGYLVAGLVGVLAGGLLVWSWHRSLDRPSTRVLGAGDRDGDAVARELERGRRYERPFVLLRLPDHSFDTPGAPSAEAVDAVVASLRTIDFAWVDEAGMHILLPEARRAEGEACIRRLLDVAPSLANAEAQLAVFPDDGVTRGALFSRLSGVADILPQADELPQPGQLPTPDVAGAPDLADPAEAPVPRWAS